MILHWITCADRCGWTYPCGRRMKCSTSNDNPHSAAVQKAWFMKSIRSIDLKTAVSHIKQVSDNARERQERLPFFFVVGAGISHPSVPLAAEIEQHCRSVAQQYLRRRLYQIIVGRKRRRAAFTHASDYPRRRRNSTGRIERRRYSPLAPGRWVSRVGEINSDFVKKRTNTR